jgi:integrase
MNSSYKVRVWKLEVRKNSSAKITSYRVRWDVEGITFRESFKLRAAADGFRAELLSGQRRGEDFDKISGMPRSLNRASVDLTWFDLTCRYMDMKWPDLAATARQTVAESLIRVFPVFVAKAKSAPDPKVLRSALRQWAYNTPLRNGGTAPLDVQQTLDWCSRNTLSVKVALEPDTLRELQRLVTRRLDGKPFAPTVARKTRSVLWNLLDYAVELKLIEVNPLASVKWTAMPKGKRKIDKRAVPNPIQARTLLLAVRETPRSGERLEAFFGTMYFSALRPEEAAALTKSNLDLPVPKWNEETGVFEYGWGKFHLDEARPHIGARWTDDGAVRDRRGLKSRSAGEGRTVPCPPELTGLICRHIAKFGYGADDLVFSGERGGEIPMITYTRTWRAARAKALTEEAQATPLASRPYDLRHAAVSTWLAAGVDPATVAEWAGQSLSVLMEIYAAMLYGQGVLAQRLVQTALGHDE